MVLESNTLDVLFVKDGQQGEDGKILYTWIKYAKDASGTGITDDPNGAIYIGISYNNESSIESNDPTHYAWTKIQGADGKKGEDAYTIFLENENISFATDKNRNPLSEQAYTSGITIMKGAKPVTDFTIGDIAKTQGIAVAKTDTAIAISVVNGNPLPNDNGEIEIPITVGGTVFKKILTWTCAKKGDQGEKGENGKDGTSVTIINKSITYQLSTSGTVIPKGTWQTSPQTIPEGQYQWTKTSVTYSDGNKTESYSISYHGKNGNDGTSVKTTGTSVKYQVGDSGTTKPTGTWQSNVPTVAQGKYLWTQTIVNYSDGNSTESYSVSYRGIDGSNGVNGMNTATIYLYQRATSTPSKPSNTLTYTFSTTKITGTLNNGWSTTIPTGTDAVYVTVASVSSKNDTATIATSVWSAPVVLAQNGKTGSDGKAGLNVATIYLYQRNTSKPSKPSASVTYTFSTGVASGLNNGWSQKIPNGTNPLYVTLATASSNTATDTILSSEWSDVVVMAQNGEDGQDGISPKVSLLKSGDTTTISIVDATGTHTQTVKDGTNGTPGAAGKDGKTSYFHVKYSNDGGKTFTGNSGEDTGTYMGSYTDYTEADSTDVKKYNWVKVKGDKGDKGDTGQKGQDGTSVKITSKSVTYQTSTSGTIAPTGTWVTTVPTINNGQYLWTKTTVQYSDGNKTEAYSVSYKGTNGTNGTSVTVSKTEVTYQVSTSGTTAPTGTWSTTMPSCDQGQYLWTKTYVKYSDGKDTTSYSVSYKGVDGEKFAFNMLRETNQGSKHWVNMGASGKYSVESITTEDSINAVKLICTEPIASNEWQFCEFSDYEMLKSLKASTAYTLSYDIKTNRSGKISHNIKTGGGQKPFFANDISCKVLGNETWEHVSLKMTSGTTLPNLDRQVIYMFDNALSKVGYSIIKNLKLTEGIVDTPWAPHPEDLEGRGVSETVQYYLATSKASGVTSFTSGWSTDITTQKLTADKKYLWNCYQTKYSDGTSEPISTPKVIGVYGDKGNGIVASVQRPNKTEFWWSQVGAVGHKDTFDDSSNTRNNCRVGDIFTVMGTSTEGNSHTVYYKSATDSGDLAGECINHVIAESGTDAKNLSITPSSQYFKSTDGGKTFAPNTITIKPTIQGEINFGKWQYSIDGGVSFADVVSGQKGLTISNNVLTVSKDSGLYSDAVTMVTFRAVASDSSFYDTCSIAKIYDVSDIGDGRNLWITRDNITLQACEKDKYIYTTTGTSAVCIGADVSSVGTNTIALQTGTKYTISFVISSPSEVSNARWFFCTALNNTGAKNYGGYGVKLVTGENIVSQTITVDTSCDAAGLVIYNLPTDCIIKDIQVEKGSSPTGWTPAPEDIQTAILSTKSEISDVSLKVDKNKQAIEQRVEKTTYQQDLNLVKGDISKANEGLNKWRYEIYPKSLFASEYQGKSTMDVFAKNTNLTPSQSVLINDTDLSIAWNYDNNYIGYALTFVKFSAAKSVAITFAHDDGAHIYLNGKLIGGNDVYNNKGESLTLGFVKGWNCIEVVVNEGASTEGFKLGTTLSALSECQLMNCYYGTPVARQSHITNQLVQNTTDIDGVSTKVSKVTSVIGDNGENFTSFKNDYSDFKLAMDGFKTTVGKTYVTKDDFNGLEIGGVNLFVKSTASRGWWISDTGVLNANGGWGYSDYIDVSGMKNYIASGFTNLGISPATCFYDSNKTFISGVESKNQNSQDSKRKTLPIPSNAKYMRFSFALADINTLKIEQGTKATVYSPSPYDDEINGQNLVSNLPANWEQGTVTEGSAVGTTYANTKSASAGSIRPKELIPVSGYITISTAYSNQSQKPIRHWIAAYDVNKNYLGVNYVSNSWNSFPRTLDMKDAKYLAIMVGYTDSSAITPSDISKICLKIERGTSATPFTLAPEDVNGKIQSVETIATQTADKFSWLVKSGTSSSNFELTDKTATLVADKINMDGLVTFNGLDSSARDRINTVTSGNLITVTPANPKSDYGGGQTYNVIADDKGGRCVQWNSSCASFLLLNSYTPVNFTSSDQLYYDIRVPNWSSTTFDTKLTIWFYNKNKALITSASKTLTLKSTIWNHFTGYLTLPSSSNWGDLYYYIIGLTNPNKQAIGFTNDSYIEKVNSYATAYAKNAVDWVGQNGTNTNNMYNMVSKWTDGAVSDTTQINGGWIKANTITASKIAVGDFTNYCQLNKDTASSYGFTATDDTKGVWFTASPIDRDKDISQWFTCEGSQKLYVEYDLSTTVKGKVNASDTGTSYLTSGIMIFAANGTKEIISYTRSKGVTATSDGTVTHISLVETLPADARFFRVVLQTDGKRNTFSGTLKIRDPQVRKATTGKLIVDGSITANKIATDAIKSRNYISSGGTQGSFLNLSDGSFKSPNLSWDSNGNLIAKNANLSGEINATEGSIGGWNIKDSLYSNTREPYDISKYYAKKILNKPSFTNICMNTNVLSAANYGTVGGDHVTIGDSLIATNTAYSFGVNISLGRISLFGSTYYTSDLASELNKSSSLSLSGDKISFWEYDEDGHEISEQNNTYITSNYARFSGDIFIGGDIGTDGGADIGGKLQASSIAAKNGGLIETAGTIYGGGEIQCGGGQMRIIGGDYGILLRNDGSDFYILSTDSGNQYGYWNSKRPFRINLANGIPYFEYGIIIPNENYLLGNGYQMCRGTSWGGVCIGDDSKGLRFYGTSIWASHSISTSDENLKENFTTLDQYEDFYMNLNPIGFNYIGDYDGKKTHFGFGAHKTEDILESEGYDSEKFAVVTHRPLVQEDIEKRFGKDVDVDIETEYGVSYTEFIALNTHMIQKTRKELETVKQEKADLETRLQAIEAKLGL